MRKVILVFFFICLLAIVVVRVNFPGVSVNKLCKVQENEMSIYCSEHELSFCQEYDYLFEEMYGVSKKDHVCKKLNKTSEIYHNGAIKEEYMLKTNMYLMSNQKLHFPVSCILRVFEESDTNKKPYKVFEYFDERKISNKCDYLIYKK